MGGLTDHIGGKGGGAQPKVGAAQLLLKVSGLTDHIGRIGVGVGGGGGGGSTALTTKWLLQQSSWDFFLLNKSIWR